MVLEEGGILLILLRFRYVGSLDYSFCNRQSIELFACDVFSSAQEE